MRRAFRCRVCHELLGYVYDEEIELPLPKCPKGHSAELVPETSAEEARGLAKSLGLTPSATECRSAEAAKDPHTFRQRIGKQRTGG